MVNISLLKRPDIVQHPGVAQRAIPPATAHPELLAQLAAGLPELVFGEVIRYAPGQVTAEHSHGDLYQLNRFRTGAGTFTSDGRQAALRRAAVYLVPPRRLHGFTSSQGRPLRGLTIRFRLPGHAGAAPAAIMDVAAPVLARIDTLLVEAIAAGDSADRLVSGLRLAEALGLLLRHGTPAADLPRPSSLTGRAVEFMEERFRERLAITDVAGQVGVTPFHLCRAFKHELGTSPMAMLRKIRTGHAAERLFRSEEPLAAIAADAGFGTLKNLRRAFVEQHGIAPQEFRERHREVRP